MLNFVRDYLGNHGDPVISEIIHKMDADTFLGSLLNKLTVPEYK